MRLFAELLEEQGRAAIWVTHSAELATAHGFTPIFCRVQPDEAGGSRSVICHGEVGVRLRASWWPTWRGERLGHDAAAGLSPRFGRPPA